MKKISFIFGFLFFLGGCSCTIPKSPIKKIKIPKKNNLQIDVNKKITFKVTGMGVAPCENMCNISQAKVMARRAAILNAYEELAEKIDGIEIKGQDSVKNMMSTDNQISANVKGLIKGAFIDKEEFKNGIYYVTMSLKIDAKNWNNNLIFK